MQQPTHQQHAAPPTVLVVGPHPDDQELGMGATIAKLAHQGHRVVLLDVTTGEPTPLGSPEQRAKEAAAAAQALSPSQPPQDPNAVPSADPNTNTWPVQRILLDLPNREVVHSIEARHKVAGVIRAIQPHILFLPYFHDAHPDHLAVTRIAEDARFDAKLTSVDMPAPPPLPAYIAEDPETARWYINTRVAVGPPNYPRWLFYYYATHLRWVADPTFCFDTTGYTAHKHNAINAYHTQFVLPEHNRKVVHWLEAAATYFGSRIATETAEPFFTKEPLALNSLRALPPIHPTQ